MKNYLYNEIIISPTTTIRQYLTTEKLYAKYTDLDSYGIRIEKIQNKHGGSCTITSTEINNLFFKKNDAEKFLKFAGERKTYPAQLKADIDEFVISNYISVATL